jgi:hypothetical protein
MIKIVKELFPLFLVQFFTWIGLFALWIYATPVITKYVFNTTDSESIAFENGTTWVGICFAFYSTLAAALAFTIPKLLKYISKQKLHSIALFIGSIGLLLLFFIKQKYFLFISFSFIGIAWSSIGNIPYNIISSIAPENKLVQYFAIFNFSVVIPQITSAFLLSYINKHFFNNETNYIMLFGAACMLLASVIMCFVKEKSLYKDAEL